MKNKHYISLQIEEDNNGWLIQILQQSCENKHIIFKNHINYYFITRENIFPASCLNNFSVRGSAKKYDNKIMKCLKIYPDTIKNLKETIKLYNEKNNG